MAIFIKCTGLEAINKFTPAYYLRYEKMHTDKYTCTVYSTVYLTEKCTRVKGVRGERKVLSDKSAAVMYLNALIDTSEVCIESFTKI